MYTVITRLKDIGLHAKILLIILGIMVNIVNGYLRKRIFTLIMNKINPYDIDS